MYFISHTTIFPRIALGNRTIAKRVMVNRLRYHRHKGTERMEVRYILKVAKQFKIVGKNKVRRSCFIWEDSLREGDCNMAGIERMIYEGLISEEKDEGHI